jgi:hypothetical protein
MFRWVCVIAISTYGLNARIRVTQLQLARNLLPSLRDILQIIVSTELPHIANPESILSLFWSPLESVRFS